MRDFFEEIEVEVIVFDEYQDIVTNSGKEPTETPEDGDSNLGDGN